MKFMDRILAYAPNQEASLRMPLQRSGIPYRFAKDARQLERELERFKPSVVLTDVPTSKTSGANLLRRVRSRALVVLVDASVEGQIEHALERLREGPLVAAGRRQPIRRNRTDEAASGRGERASDGRRA